CRPAPTHHHEITEDEPMSTVLGSLALLGALTAPTAATADNGGLKGGIYKGPAQLFDGPITRGGRGALTIKSLENGKVKAHSEASNGLAGSFDLDGTIDDAGVFRFRGESTEEAAGIVYPIYVRGKAKVSGETIKGQFTFERRSGSIVQQYDG